MFLSRIARNSAFVTLALILSSGAFAKNLALLIGIDEYGDRDGISRLSGAENDVDGIKSALVDAAGFAPGDIEVLKGSQASRIGVVKALERLRAKSLPGDLIFFSFSGHGFQPGDKVFLVPHDALAGSDAVLQNSSLEASEVARMLGQVNADVLIASFDMCRNDPRVRSGRDVQPLNSMSYAMERDLKVVPTSAGKGPRRILRMFASSQGQRSWENPKTKRGYFSWFLEQGLRGQASPDGVIKVSSLIEFLEQEVITAVQRDRQVEQRPEIKLEGSQLLSFILSRPKAPVKRVQTEFDSLVKQALALVDKLASQFTLAEGQTAEKLLKRADAINGSDPIVKHQLGRIAHKAGRFSEAEALYKRAIELAPSYSPVFNSFGALSFDFKKDFKEAERLYRKAIELNPRDAFAFYNLGKLQFEVLKDYTQAERSYRRAIALDPKDSMSLNNLGFLFFNVYDKHDQAKIFYLRAILTDRGNSLAYNNYGVLLQNAYKQFDEAEENYRKAIETDPENSLAYNNLGHLLETVSKNYAEAEKMYRKAIETDPKNSLAYNNYHAFLMQRNRRKDAENLRKTATANGVTIRMSGGIIF